MGGLTKKVICAALIIAAFGLGKLCSRAKIEKSNVFSYIDCNKEDRKEIFLYTKDYLRKDEPYFLDSLNISELTDEQKEELIKDYLKNSGNIIYQKSKGFLEKARDKTKRAYEEFKK